jgi:hypothetical protein
MYDAELEAHRTGIEQALVNVTPKQFQEENALRKKYNLRLLKEPKNPFKPSKVNLMAIYVADYMQNHEESGLSREAPYSKAIASFKCLNKDQVKVRKPKTKSRLKEWLLNTMQYISFLGV